jgi:hypothetical protein
VGAAGGLPAGLRAPPGRTAGLASLVLGIVSVCSLVPSLLGLPRGVAVWLRARNDLSQMRAGRMDPRGEGRTDEARGSAIAAVALNLLGLTVLLAFLASSLL